MYVSGNGKYIRCVWTEGPFVENSVVYMKLFQSNEKDTYFLIRITRFVHFKCVCAIKPGVVIFAKMKCSQLTFEVGRMLHIFTLASTAVYAIFLEII